MICWIHFSSTILNQFSWWSFEIGLSLLRCCLSRSSFKWHVSWLKKKKAALYLISLYQYLVPLFASPLRRQSSPTSTSRFSRSYGAASISDDSGWSPFSFQTPAELIPRDIFSTCHTSFDTKIKCCLTFEGFYLFRCT